MRSARRSSRSHRGRDASTDDLGEQAARRLGDALHLLEHPRSQRTDVVGLAQERQRLIRCLVRGQARGVLGQARQVEQQRHLPLRLGGRVGVAPRIFLKKLVGEVLDRVDQFADFDPRRDYALTIADAELTPAEREARPATSVDDVELML